MFISHILSPNLGPVGDAVHGGLRIWTMARGRSVICKLDGFFAVVWKLRRNIAKLTWNCVGHPPRAREEDLDRISNRISGAQKRSVRTYLSSEGRYLLLCESQK